MTTKCQRFSLRLTGLTLMLSFNWGSVFAESSPKHLATTYGASITPEAVVIDNQGKALNAGRIDDRYYQLGRQRNRPFSKDLELVIDQVAKGSPIQYKETKAVGCFLPKRQP